MKIDAHWIDESSQKKSEFYSRYRKYISIFDTFMPFVVWSTDRRTIINVIDGSLIRGIFTKKEYDFYLKQTLLYFTFIPFVAWPTNKIFI